MKSKKIFLIHGLGGDPKGTWGQFPDLLKQDDALKDFGIHLITYKSPNPLSISSIFSKGKGISEIADTVLSDIKTQCAFGNDELVLAGHSLGGLILTKIILNLDDQNKLDCINKICFFDTPFEGSSLANISAYFPIWNINYLRNRHLRELCTSSYYLEDLLSQWVHKKVSDKLDVLNLIADDSKVVNKASARSIHRGEKTEVIKEVDHLSIVKPENRESLVYRHFLQFILKKKV